MDQHGLPEPGRIPDRSWCSSHLCHKYEREEDGDGIGDLAALVASE